MKKFFLLFAFLSFTSFNNAFAAPPPVDICQDYGPVWGIKPVACFLCLDALQQLYYYWSDNLGKPSCSDAEKYYQWSEVVGNYKAEYELQRDNFFQSCWSEADEMVSVLELYAGEICKGRTPIEICTSDDNLCNCDIGRYNARYGEIGTFACSECPENGESIGGNELITSCYLPAGTGETDTTGTWQYSQNCYYTK